MDSQCRFWYIPACSPCHSPVSRHADALVWRPNFPRLWQRPRRTPGRNMLRARVVGQVRARQEMSEQKSAGVWPPRGQHRNSCAPSLSLIKPEGSHGQPMSAELLECQQCMVSGLGSTRRSARCSWPLETRKWQLMVALCSDSIRCLLIPVVWA